MDSSPRRLPLSPLSAPLLPSLPSLPPAAASAAPSPGAPAASSLPATPLAAVSSLLDGGGGAGAGGGLGSFSLWQLWLRGLGPGEAAQSLDPREELVEHALDLALLLLETREAWQTCALVERALEADAVPSAARLIGGDVPTLRLSERDAALLAASFFAPSAEVVRRLLTMPTAAAVAAATAAAATAAATRSRSGGSSAAAGAGAQPVLPPGPPPQPLLALLLAKGAGAAEARRAAIAAVAEDAGLRVREVARHVSTLARLSALLEAREWRVDLLAQLRARLCLGPRLCWQWAALLLLVRYGVVCAASAAPGARSSRPLRTPALLACASALLAWLVPGMAAREPGGKSGAARALALAEAEAPGASPAAAPSPARAPALAPQLLERAASSSSRQISGGSTPTLAAVPAQRPQPPVPVFGVCPTVVAGLRLVLAHPALGRVAAPLEPALMARVTAPRIAALVRTVRELAALIVQAADGGAAGAVALRPFIILADSAVAALVRPADAAIAALTSEELAVCVAKVGEGVDSAAYSRFCGALGAVFAALC